MGIKKIKKENNSINISLVDLMGKLDNSETKKYTQFLVKILKKNFDNQQDFLVRDSLIELTTKLFSTRSSLVSITPVRILVC